MTCCPVSLDCHSVVVQLEKAVIGLRIPNVAEIEADPSSAVEVL